MAAIPTQPEQGALAAIQEIITFLEAEGSDSLATALRITVDDCSLQNVRILGQDALQLRWALLASLAGLLR
jgi:hypothetical protein